MVGSIPFFIQLLCLQMAANPSNTPPEPPQRCPDGLRSAFRLEDGIVFLNHGSFGAVPEPVAAAAQHWRQQIESRPVEMLARRMNGLLGDVRTRVGEYLAADPARIGLIGNATSGVGAVLNSIHWKTGDRIVVSNHGYNAVRQAAQNCCERFGCELIVVDLPLPFRTAHDVVNRFLSAVDDRTRLVIVDHITSPTALILPVAEIARWCKSRGVLCLVDGAHAPGMIPLRIDDIGADWYTGNLHKWVCAPRGCGFLVASPQTADWTHPQTTSHLHGHGFEAEFSWQGTHDFTNWLTIPAAIDFISGTLASGLRQHNHQLATWAQWRLCEDFQVQPISPLDGSMIGSMAAIPLPPILTTHFQSAAHFQQALYDTHHIEVPIIDWGGAWHVRVSAQAYNQPADYLALSSAVRAGGVVAGAPTAVAAGS